MGKTSILDNESESPKGRKSKVDRYRIDFKWLLKDQPVPDHATLARFRTGRCAQVAEVVRAFADAFIHSMPTGKQNSFANRTLPGDVYVTVRTDQPVNLVPAFEKPVAATSTGGYMERSEKALADYALKVYEQGMAQSPALALCVGDMAEQVGAERVTLNQLLDRVEAWIRAHVGEERAE